ncbi:hypothetical protein PYW08_014899 [Mythimna loreyi]|uniref:Uncharacterized protein n=1 Tax=Mythimna loreyi TaxID=667449 RepID=A0ACC2R8K6_9NEOP|nr:hypothetical protein PYW08_014899 [Mythimna loreyi]
MWKPLVVLVLVANTFLITPSEGTYGPYSKKSVEGNPHCKCKKPNEIYDLCPNPCPPRECGVDIRLILCAPAPKPGSKDCKPGCRCADGFLKNRAGICIPEKECKYDCAKNQTLDPCYSDCPPRYCGVNIAAISCLAIEKPDCERGCRCCDGYLENAEGNCVLEKDCPKCYGPNEVYEVCLDPCPLYRCDVDPRVIKCGPPPQPGDPKCEAGCRCLDGYARNNDGVCIPREKCPQYCPGIEIYDTCPNPCPPQRCDIDPSVIRCAAPPKPGDSKCRPGCRCPDGLVRNSEGTCIPRDQCPQNRCKGEHELYSHCPDFTCRPLNCTQVGFPVACPIPGPDPSRCPGKPGCICESGYARNNDGKCIPEKQCSPKCPKNEVYSTCINSDCGPQKCSQLGYPIPCRRIDPAFCTKGCVCKEGYVRDANGTCIPKEKCPSCGDDPNAVSGCGNNCGRLCSNYNSTEPIFCPEICNLNGCDCKKGFVLDESTGKCILPSKCVSCNGDFNAKPGCDENCSKRCPGPKPTKCKCSGCECKDGFVYDPKIRKCVRPEQCTPPCGDNEILSNCSNGGCGPWRCTDVGIPTGCVKMDQKYCKVDCVCKEGYVRDENEVCVPVTDCPECGGDPNAIAGCGVNCGRLCSNYKQAENISCIAVCYDNACDCRKGFVLDENINKCVKPKDCTPTCGKNEVFSECINGGCEAKNCSQLGKPVPCVRPAKCKPGCLCAEGYLRDAKGNCVPEDQCSAPVCKEHEVYSKCINGGCQARNCNQLGQPVPCVKLDPKSCIKGCVCEDGYLRARNGTCVPEDKCDNCNKPHEHYDPCAPSCPPQTCESIGRTYKCPITTAVCKGACRCDKGYYRNKIGECISEKNCLKCKGPHEYWSCGSACDNVCETLYKQNQTNCPIVNIQCNKMCYCEEGYARDKNNICIRIDKCPKPKCGKNERLENCPPALCTPQKCTELGFPVACPDLPMNGVCPEPPGCVCADNHVRDACGKCIPSDSCPSCGGDPHAVSGCGVNCGRTCTTYNRTDVACLEICYFNACDCRKGYVFDEQVNKCVKPKDCSRPCGKNEVYTSCANGGCGKWNCSQLGQPDLCIDPIKCIGGCICQEGYLRAKNGNCVPRNECPVPQCGKNERFEFCPGCEPQYCSELGFPLTCPESGDPRQPACICDYGYVRNENGDCIPKEECPSCGGDPNAQSGCGVNCGKLCSNYNKGPVPCPKICKVNACDCKKDFVLDQNINKCVRPKQCTPICGPDEVFSECINGGCQPKNCSQLGKPVPCIKINEKDCIKGCLCKEGYLRDLNGSCVPTEKCEQQCNGPNEVYDACPPSCPPQTCESIDKIYHCPMIKTDIKDCKPACRCKEGYWRNKIGECISKKNCLKCTGPNEYWSCGGACDNVCKDLHKQNQTNCPIKNIKCNEMCYCEKGYARNASNICVPIAQCPPPCTKPHEVYDLCPHTCPPQTCAAIGLAYPCPHPPEGIEFCNPACRCEEGYYRNSADECISEEECLKCTGPNEHFSCGPVCDNVCATLKTENQTNCPYINKRCNSKCYCDEGYARDDNNICIPIDQCGVSCHGDSNAVPGCGGYCGNRCSNYNKGPVACPLICRIGACDCKQSYVLDDNLGKCVQPKNCTPVCGKDEVYNTCINGGCERKNCSDLARPIICIHPKECKDGCLCKEGMLRADNGTCVPIDKCPTPVCPKNEVFDRFANGGCDRRTCQDLTRPILCIDPIEFIGDCVCVKGYLRNDDGICVPESECKPRCNQPNQVFNSCPSTCPPRTCESLGRAYVCPIVTGQEPPCEPGCVCEEGYFLNSIGECITEEECLKCTGPHEYYSCGGACDNVCLTLNEQSQTNCPIINIKCNEMCYCEPDYARNASNICIPIKDCPPSRCDPNERYEPHPCQVCGPLTCSEVGIEQECPPAEDKNCDDTPACICNDGLVRNDAGDCVPISECSSETAVNVTDARARLDQGSVSLSATFLHYLASNNPNENCVASPTSLLIPLAQLALYAKGLVLEQLLKLLNLKNKEEIKACFPELIAEFSNQTGVDFKEASKYYANENYPLSAAFKLDSKIYFGAEGENIDFSQPEEAAEIINEWVYNQTRGKIQDLVKPDMFDEDTRLCLVNAIYFLGNWTKQFNPENTEVKDFYKSNGETVPLKIMYQQNTFNYAETDQYQVLEMFYEGGNFSCVIVLPRNKEDLLPTLKTLQEPGHWDGIMESLTPQKCQVYLPKMLINTQIDVKKLLIENGADEMFDPWSDGFEGMLEKPEPVYVSDAVQKAFLSLDEKGTEAAAATAIIGAATTSVQIDPPKIYLFEAIRSYVYYIVYNGVPIFCGTFVGAPQPGLD